MLLMVFELYYVSFGQFIAAFSPNELFASLLVPCFFTFVVAFCGVVVPYVALPHFWQSWMYWLTPFHYLLEGFLGVLTHNIPVRCVSREMTQFSPPPGQTCQSYAGAFAKQAGGYVEDAAGGLCSYCPYSIGDAFVRSPSSPSSYMSYSGTNISIQAASFNVFYSHKWRAYVSVSDYCCTRMTADKRRGSSGLSPCLISRLSTSSPGFIFMASRI
jgi:ABC-type multidrug transport system permease subunit